MFIRLLLAAATLTLSSYSMAASVVYETRSITNTVNNADYKASWGQQSSVITTQTMNDFNNVYAPSAGFSHLQVSFQVTAPGLLWGFRLAPDAGLGGAIYMDNVLLSKDTSDLWWGGAWSNTTELLIASNLTLAVGTHKFDAYWAEVCCNGWQSMQFTNDGGQSWKSLADLPAPVPSPSTLWLVVPALIGMSGAYRRKAFTAA